MLPDLADKREDFVTLIREHLGKDDGVPVNRHYSGASHRMIEERA